MNHKLNFVALILLPILMSAGCQHTYLEEDGIYIRIRNASLLSMDSIEVGFPKENIRFGNVEPGGESTYKKVETAYRYAAVAAIVDEKEVRIQPIDYVGESELDPGFYTYVLDIDKQTLESEHYTFALTLRLQRE